MRRVFACLFAAVLASACAPPAFTQALVDTVYTWQGYVRTGTCHLRIYAAPPGEDRTRTVVVRELAENAGPSTVADARHLVELIGRHFEIDPTEATWVFHWGAFSFEGAGLRGRKELFLRATFRRLKSQNLSTPSWKVISREEVEAYTDRQFR